MQVMYKNRELECNMTHKEGLYVLVFKSEEVSGRALWDPKRFNHPTIANLEKGSEKILGKGKKLGFYKYQKARDWVGGLFKAYKEANLVNKKEPQGEILPEGFTTVELDESAIFGGGD